MKNFELHIFTNSTINSPSTELIAHTYNSFLKTFNLDCPVTVWYDPKPNKEKADLYHKNLTKIFTNINITKSLSDGYISAVKNSSADFLFMLEHDWQFLDNINDGLQDICSIMFENKLCHLRFNKRANESINVDKNLVEIKERISYCITPALSNNPHIVNRSLYIDQALPYVKLKSGAKGIEHKLFKVKDLYGAIYGPLKYPPTIKHLDGKTNENL